MNKDYKKEAKNYLTLPIIITVVIVISMIMATILEGPTNRGSIYTLFASVMILGIIFAPLPCFIMSIIGTIKAIKAKTRGLTILGIAEVAIGVIAIILATLILIFGQSV